MKQPHSVSDSRINRIELHHLGKKIHDNRPGERSINQARAPKHDHQGKIKAGKRTVQTGRNMAQIIRLQDAGDTREMRR